MEHDCCQKRETWLWKRARDILTPRETMGNRIPIALGFGVRGAESAQLLPVPESFKGQWLQLGWNPDEIRLLSEKGKQTTHWYTPCKQQSEDHLGHALWRVFPHSRGAWLREAAFPARSIQDQRNERCHFPPQPCRMDTEQPVWMRPAPTLPI